MLVKEDQVLSFVSWMKVSRGAAESVSILDRGREVLRSCRKGRRLAYSVQGLGVPFGREWIWLWQGEMELGLLCCASSFPLDC